MVASLVLIVLGLASLLAPFLVPDLPLGRLGGIFVGISLMTLGVVVGYFRLYRKTRADEAFVRTGQSGEKAILGGGAIVVPLVHNIVNISLETMKLMVQRRGPDALITADNLRVDVEAEFYIKVAPRREDVLAAARSLGEKGTNPKAVAELVFEKLVSALRSVAATKQLQELHSNREEFASAVSEAVRNDLQHNGLTLETVTISQLDQTNVASLSDENIFDAQGKRRIAEITQAAQTERTQIEEAAEVERNTLRRTAERQRRQQDVLTQKEILELDRDKAQAEAGQRTLVANAQAEAERTAKEFSLEQHRQVEESRIANEQAVQERQATAARAVQVAKIEQERAVEQSNIERQQAIETAREAQEQAVEVAAQQRQQAVEVASRQRQAIIAEQEAQRATAEAAALDAEAERETAAQKVQTVRETSEAERDGQKKLITTEKAAREQQVREEMAARVKAFAVTAQAEAEQQAAEAQATAQLRLAEAQSAAAKLAAEGERAKEMVPVEVERERVAVLEAELQAKAEHESVAIELEKYKLLIQGQVEIAQAQSEALAMAFSSAKMTIWGDPDALNRMTEQFGRGQSMAALVDGLASNLPPELQQLASGLMGKLGTMVNGGEQAAEATEAAEPEVPEPDAES